MTFELYIDIMIAILLTAFVVGSIHCGVLVIIAFTRMTHDLFWRKKQ